MAGTAERTLALKLIADVGSLNKDLKKTQGTLKRTASAAKSWGKALTGALVIRGIETLVGGLDDAFKGFKEGEDAARTLGQTWKNLGRDGDQLAGVLEGLNTKALDMGFDDAEVVTAFNTFLTKTGSVKKSLTLVQQAMDLARAKNISFGKAAKLVAGNLDLSDKALARNKRQARIWARNHPLEVSLGKISDLWSEFVGQFSKGNINKAFAALGGIGTVIDELIFGKELEGGGRVEGLLDKFVKMGEKIAPQIVAGAAGLGAAIGKFWDEEIAPIDWGKAIGDAIGNAIKLVSSNSTVKDNLGILGVSLATGIFVATIFSNVLSTMLKAPAFLASAALKAAITLAGGALAVALQFAMFLSEAAMKVFSAGLAHVFTAMPIGIGSKIQLAANALGKGVALVIAGGVAFGLPLALSVVLKDALDNLLPGGTRLRFNPETGQMERYEKGTSNFPGGIGLVGEQGPELVQLPKGSRIWPNDESMAMMGGWGGGGITINVNAGVGDPVEIGRQVDRVLRAYRGRAGLAA